MTESSLVTLTCHVLDGRRFANDRSVTVLEGAVGLEVVRDPVDGCVLCLNPRASLVVERLNRDKAETGYAHRYHPNLSSCKSDVLQMRSFRPVCGGSNVMVDILETTGVGVLFRHNLTTHSWGITTLHTCVGAVIALTGQPMAQGLRSCGHTRLLCAALLRECRLVSDPLLPSHRCLSAILTSSLPAAYLPDTRCGGA